METIYRYDEEEHVLHMETGNPRVAKRWRRRGYAVTPGSFYPGGTEARTWRAKGPVEALGVRRVQDGQVVKRSRPKHAFTKAKPGRAQDTPDLCVGPREYSRETEPTGGDQGVTLTPSETNGPTASPLAEPDVHGRSFRRGLRNGGKPPRTTQT
jgi:hypothetical protein